MGQKVNPTGIRLGISETWRSKWFSQANYAKNLNQDINIRNYLNKKYSTAAVSKIEIDRPTNNIIVTIHTARPGMIIGKKGQDIELLKSSISKLTKTKDVIVKIEEVRNPELDSRLVALNVATQLEKRVMFRRAMKRAVQSALRSGAKGIKISIAGRLNGAEIARTEWYREGRVPLHTFKSNIDYATARANTTYGVIGIKIWIYKGDVNNQQSEAK